MEKLDKVEVFKQELALITDEAVRVWTEKAIGVLPDYFFIVPASSTGKYHPDYALGEGGLVRHTKAAVRIAKELFTITPFEAEEKDIVYSALTLHDGGKHGLTHDRYSNSPWLHSLHEHPLIISQWLQAQSFFNDIPQAILIVKGIESHMGQWNKSDFSSVVLPLPQTKTERFIHMCDYLASRKCLEFNFEVAG